MARKPSKQRFTVVHPDCAAIDVGGREHFVAVDPRHENPVQSFTSFTDDLLKMRISEHRDRPFRLIVTAHFANA